MCTIPLAMMRLIMFTAVFCIIFVDRGGWAVALNRVENDFDLSNLQGGIIGASFMVGYAASAFVFAHFSSSVPPFQLMAWGILAWIGAVVMCGLAFDFWSMLCARIFVGVGEAAYLVLAPPLIDSIAPRDRRSSWLGYFFMSIPVGFAIGNVIAGFWLNYHKVGTESWRVFFFFEAALMSPFFFITLFAKGPPNINDEEWINEHLDQESDKLSGGFIGTDTDTVVTAADDYEERESLAAGESSSSAGKSLATGKAGGAGSTAAATIAGEAASIDADEAADSGAVEKEHFCRRLGNVLGNWVFLSLALGYAAQNFVVGAFSYFGIQYVVTVLKFSVAIAGLAFGLMTLFTGVLGIWFGGWWLDRLRRDCLADDLKSTEKSVKSLLIMTLLALPFAGASFIVGPKYPIVFFVLIAPGEFFLFATVAPINAAFMWCVHPFYRTLAVACSVFIQHLLGDAPSPVVVGWLIDFTGSMTTALIIAAGWLLFSVIFFGIAYHLIYTRNRKRDEENGVLPEGEESANGGGGGGDDDAGVVSTNFRKRRATATDADAVFRDAAGGGGGGSDESGTAMRRPSRGGDSATLNVYDSLRTPASSSTANELGDEVGSDLQHH